MKKLISVIVPCYNQAHFLPETLESVLSQTYKEWECIIVDDGSSDDTKNVAGEFCKFDSRFKYIWQQNQGLSCTRNTGIRSSVGEYIFPLDSDDKIHPDYFAVAIEIFSKNPNIGIIYSQAELFDQKVGPWLLKEFSLENILLQSVIYASAFFKRSDYDKTDGYDLGMKYGWEDWDFWLSILELGVKVHYIESVYFYYRYRLESMTRQMTDEQRNYLYKRIYLRHHNSYERLFGNPFQLYFELDYYKKSGEYKLGRFMLYPLIKIKYLIQKYA